MPFLIIQHLENAGWTQYAPYCFRKGNWIVIFDTGAWMEVGTDATPRIFDVPTPDEDKADWTLSLIEHLCRADDELQRLKRG